MACGKRLCAWTNRSIVRPKLSVPHVDLALEISRRYQTGYYKALILSAARFMGCDVVYSEDLNDGQDYGGVIVTNPFREK